jgi:Flp pilus assembly protein TadD
MRWCIQVAALAASSGLSVSCVHQVVTKPSAQPMTVWDRQVHNAVDAGDGDYQLRALREKVAAEPDNVAVRVELASAYEERGFHEVALEISRLAVARFPESGEAQLSLVRDLRAVKRRAEAIAALEGFLASHPDSGSKFYSWLGILRDEAGAWPLGEPAHRKALELAPAADYLHNNLGYNLLMQKKNAEAEGEFEQALRLNPNSVTARNNLALAQARSGATGKALANWQAASDPATAHSNLAAVWIEKRNFAEARTELQLALGYNKAHSAALKNLELLDRLESQPPRSPSNREKSRWERWKLAFHRFAVVVVGDSRTDAGKSASAAQ